VRTASGEPITWQPSDQILPVSEELAAYLASSAYETAVQDARAALVDAGLQVLTPAVA
jgi:hypothetical protein